MHNQCSVYFFQIYKTQVKNVNLWKLSLSATYSWNLNRFQSWGIWFGLGFPVWVFQHFLVMCTFDILKWMTAWCKVSITRAYFFLILWYLNKIILIPQELALEKAYTNSLYFFTSSGSSHASLTLMLLEHLLKSFRPQSHALGMQKITNPPETEKLNHSVLATLTGLHVLEYINLVDN